MQLRPRAFSFAVSHCVAAAAMLVAVSAAMAADAVAEIASKNACMSCHAVDKKIVGPAFQTVA